MSHALAKRSRCAVGSAEDVPSAEVSSADVPSAPSEVPATGSNDLVEAPPPATPDDVAGGTLRHKVSTHDVSMAESCTTTSAPSSKGRSCMKRPALKQTMCVEEITEGAAVPGELDEGTDAIEQDGALPNGTVAPGGSASGARGGGAAAPWRQPALRQGPAQALRVSIDPKAKEKHFDPEAPVSATLEKSTPCESGRPAAGSKEPTETKRAEMPQMHLGRRPGPRESGDLSLGQLVWVFGGSRPPWLARITEMPKADAKRAVYRVSMLEAEGLEGSSEHVVSRSRPCLVAYSPCDARSLALVLELAEDVHRQFVASKAEGNAKAKAKAKAKATAKAKAKTKAKATAKAKAKDKTKEKAKAKAISSAVYLVRKPLHLGLALSIGSTYTEAELRKRCQKSKKKLAKLDQLMGESKVLKRVSASKDKEGGADGTEKKGKNDKKEKQGKKDKAENNEKKGKKRKADGIPGEDSPAVPTELATPTAMPAPEDDARFGDISGLTAEPAQAQAGPASKLADSDGEV